MTATLDKLASAPGTIVYRDMPAEEYHALDRLNAGKVAAFAKSTLQGVFEMERKRDPTMDMAFGTALHARILEPGDFAARHIDRPDIGPASRVGYAKACEEQPNAIILAKDWLERIEGVRAGIRKCQFAESLMFGQDDAVKEITILWSETYNGVEIPCKARLDYLAMMRNIVADLKSTNNIEPGRFERTIGDFMYQVKGAWYCRAAERAGLVTDPRMVWITVETSAPYKCQPYMASPRLMEQGWAEACVGLHRFVAHREGRADPLPPPQLMTVDLPVYMQIDPDTLHQFTSQH